MPSKIQLRSSQNQHAQHASASARRWRIAAVALAGCLVVCLAGSQSATAATITIDAFSAASSTFYQLMSAPNPVVLPDSVSGSGAIDGQRDLMLQAFPSAGNPIVSDTLLVTTSNGVLNIATNGTVPAETTLQYSGLHTYSGSSPFSAFQNAYALGGSSGVGKDFGGAGGEFVVNFIAGTVDIAITMAVTMTSPAGVGNPGGDVSTVTNIPVPIGTTTLDIPFSSFTGNANTSNLTSLTFAFNTSKVPNADFKLDTLSAITVPNPVPEPSSLALLAIAGAALAGYTRMRSRKTAA